MILAELPEAEYAGLAKSLVSMELPLGMKLSQPSQPIDYVYFPNTGLVSTDVLTESGDSVEVGVVGREGLVGLPGLLGLPQMSHSVRMQGAGSGLRARTQIVRDEFLKGGALAEQVHLFMYLQTVQISQSVLCNRLHDVEQRLSRWLLTSADRMEVSTLQLTQEFLAEMLGARRSTVTVAAGRLQRAGMIDYSRGKIRLTDRAALQTKCCECYFIVRDAYERHLPKRFVEETRVVPMSISHAGAAPPRPSPEE